jgi:hypothetical protein
MSTTTVASSSIRPIGQSLHIALWIFQVLLVLAFAAGSFMKLALPYATLAKTMPWAARTPEMAVRGIGAIELLGALGLLLPSILRILPVLTPIAAAGLVFTMLGAVATEISAGGNPVTPLAFGLLAAFVAWGRLFKAPIAPKS